MIWRVGIRELKHGPGRILLLGLVLLCLGSVLGGGIAAPKCLLEGRDRIYSQLRFADWDIVFRPVFDDDVPLEALQRLGGVAAVDCRLIVPAHLEQDAAPQRRPFPLYVVFLDAEAEPDVNRIAVLDGLALESDRLDSVLVDKSLARSCQIRVGDRLRVRLLDGELGWKVRGIGLSPRFLLPAANPDLLWPPRGSLGIVYAPRNATDAFWTDARWSANPEAMPNRRYFVRRIAQAKAWALAQRLPLVRALGWLASIEPRPVRGRLCNNLLFRFAPDADHEAAKQAILKRLRNLEITRAETPTTNYGYRFLEEDLRGAYLVTPFGVILIALLASAVALITVSRLVEVRRRHLGTLMALGFSPGQIVAAMLLVTGLPALAAGLLSLPGAHFFAAAIVYAYTDFFHLPRMAVQIPLWLQAACVATPVGVALLASLIPLLAVLRLEPVEAIRGAKRRSFSGLPGGVDRWLSSVGPATRFAVRNLFRRPRFSAGIVVTVGLGIAMPAAFLTCVASWARWVEDVLAQMNYDAVVTLASPLAPSRAERLIDLAGIARSEPYLSGHVFLIHPDSGRRGMRLLGLPTRPDLQRLAIVEGRPFRSEDAQEVILNRNYFPGGTPPPVGHWLEVEHGGRRHRLRVVGLVSGADFRTFYTPLKTARRILGLCDEVSGYVVQLRPTPGVDAVRTALLERPEVSRFQTHEQIGRTAREYVQAFRVLMFPVVAAAGVFCLLFLATVLRMLLRDRELEYAVLRAIGTPDREIARIVSVEAGWLSGCAVAVAVPLWVGLAQILRMIMAMAYFDVGLPLRLVDFLPVAAAAVGFLALGAIPGIWYLLRLPVARTIQAYIRE